MNDISERRLHPRREWKIKLRYAIDIFEDLQLKKLDLFCETVDISAGGLCLDTDYPIEPGHVLRFGNKLSGIAKWSARFANTYRIGINFI